jgi:hypothetical protein
MKLIFLKILLLAGIIAAPCTTRVSEWVLINSLPAQYTLVYYHKDPLSESVKKQNSDVASMIKSGNIQFKTATREDIKDSYYALYYGNRLFSSYKEVSELKDLVVSPLREKVAAELMSGKLCVMVYLKTDNKEKDERGLAEIDKTLAASPFGKIITLVGLSRNTRDESNFASMLLNVEVDLKGIQEPMLFGVFGRFKALEPLVGKGISIENINLMIDYLTAECSCLIKDDLPGTDILFTDKWDNPKPALLNKIIDENPGIFQ